MSRLGICVRSKHSVVWCCWFWQVVADFMSFSHCFQYFCIHINNHVNARAYEICPLLLHGGTTPNHQSLKAELGKSCRRLVTEYCYILQSKRKVIPMDGRLLWHITNITYSSIPRYGFISLWYNVTVLSMITKQAKWDIWGRSYYIDSWWAMCRLQV